MQNRSETRQNAGRQIWLKVLAFVLWAVTIGLGFIEFLLVHGALLSLFLSRYAGDPQAMFKARYTIDAFRLFSFVILAIGSLLFFVFTSNYHYKHATKPRSWKLFAWTIGLELFILLLVLLI